MYVSGFDPYTKHPVHVARGHRERSRQRAMMFWWKREEWPAIREALIAWGRPDLIGSSEGCLVPAGPVRGAWIKHARDPVVGAMGMKVERASAQEIDEERWEGLNGVAV
jgi:hypothetical protein